MLKNENHNRIELATARTIKVGETVALQKFFDGVQYYQIDANQTADGIAKFESLENTFTITGQNVGNVTISVSPKGDPRVR